MIYNREKKVHETDAETLSWKTAGLNNPETYVLTHNRFNTYLVLILRDLNKAQIYKMPYRISSHDEIEIVNSFIFLNLFKPNEHLKDSHIRKPNDENISIINEDKTVFMLEIK